MIGRCARCGADVGALELDPHAPLGPEIGTVAGEIIGGGYGSAHVVADHAYDCDGGHRCLYACPVPTPCGPIIDDDLT